jgi:hypothetical protein
MNREDELQRLREADRFIAGAEAAVVEQLAYFDKLRVDGYDTALAERSLRAFTDSLSALQDRRELVVQNIQLMERGIVQPEPKAVQPAVHPGRR